MSYVTISIIDLSELHLTIANPSRLRLEGVGDSGAIIGFFMPNGSFYADFVVEDEDDYQIVSWLNGGSRG